MSFEVAAEAYDRFMGRYSVQLAPQLADFAGIAAGQRVLDVGCGPGALTGELVQRLGAEAVTAVDPSEPFVAAAKARHPGVEVQRASAESLPFDDGAFDAALAQLVVHFMADPVAGLREMARVTRPGGVVAACVWDHAGERIAAVLVLAGGPRGRSRGAGRVRGSPEPARATWPSCSTQAGLGSVEETTTEASPISRASRSGGSHSPSASARRAPMPRRSTIRRGPGCATAAVSSSDPTLHREHGGVDGPRPGVISWLLQLRP